MTEDLLDVVNCEDILVSECNYLDLYDLESSAIQRHGSLVVSHLNIHSLPDKYDDLVELLQKLDEKKLLPDICLLCETFLSEKNYKKFHFDGYDLISEYRTNKRRGGVSIMTRSHLKYIERPDLKIFDEGRFESVFIEITQKGRKNLVVGEIYRVPGTNEKEFIEKYNSIVDKIRSEHKQVIIGTDQNLDYLKINSHGNTLNFFEMNLANNVIPTIYKPTRITHNSATLIDNIYVDAELYKNIKSFIVRNDISDHYMCLTVIKDCVSDADFNSTFKIRKITDSVLRNMNASLSNRNWIELQDMSVHEGSEKIINEIKTVLDFYAPEKTMRCNINKHKHCEPWVTIGLKKSSRRCYSMYKNVCRKQKDSPEYQTYRQYRNLYNSLRRKAKFRYYQDLINENRHNSKKLWAILNKLTGKMKNKNDISEEIIVNGIKEHDANVISNAFARHYSEIGKVLADKIDRKGNIRNPLVNMRNKVEQNCFFFPTTTREIEKIIANLKSKNSCGYDGISNRILKKICPGIVKALEIVFNKSIQEGEFPSNMKLAIVKPLFKGKSRTEIINYRPVSLLPVLSKILEKIVNVRIVKFLQRHKVFYEGQYGFRHGRSTTDTIIDFTGNILENFNKGHYTIALFLDMSKAFDSISHDTLLKKLEFYGIRGNVLSWFRSYLLNRSLKVRYREVLSTCHEMTYGTPQGSVLGPLLYIILANDLAKCLTFCGCVTFADDTTIFASGNNLRFLYKKVNADLKQLSNWFDSNSLTLNLDKSKYILFRPKRKEINYNGEIELGGKVILKVSHIKFLGITLDEYLEWEFQFKQVLTKMIAGNYSLNMVKNLLPPRSKLLVYFANVHSHLNYAISAWGPMLKARDLKKLKTQQNKSIRLIYNIGKRTRLLPLYKKANILMISDLINLSLLKISYRYINGILPVRIANLFNLSNHQHNTRNRNSLRAPQHTTEHYNKSYLGRAPHLWIHLRDSLKNKPSLKTFAKSFTKYTVNNY